MKMFLCELNDKGQNIIEYLIIIAIVALGVLVGVGYIREYINTEADISMQVNSDEYFDSWNTRP